MHRGDEAAALVGLVAGSFRSVFLLFVPFLPFNSLRASPSLLAESIINPHSVTALYY